MLLPIGNWGLIVPKPLFIYYGNMIMNISPYALCAKGLDNRKGAFRQIGDSSSPNPYFYLSIRQI